MTTSRQRGFTLIELVVTLVVTGVVVGFMALFMVTPVEAYLATARRAELNDSANSAMRVLSEDIRNALPESVRFGSSGSLRALEVLLTSQAIRYRKAAAVGSTTATQVDFGTTEANFNVLGALASAPVPGDVPGLRLVIGYTGGNYPIGNTITPIGTTVNVARPPGGEDAITLTPGVTFPSSSGNNVFVLNGPVKYLCNTTAGVNTLTRYSGYPIAAAFVVGAPAGAASSVVARDVTACSFNYAVDPLHRGLVLIQLTISRNGETLNVMHQVQVESLP